MFSLLLLNYLINKVFEFHYYLIRVSMKIDES